MKRETRTAALTSTPDLRPAWRRSQRGKDHERWHELARRLRVNPREPLSEAGPTGSAAFHCNEYRMTSQRRRFSAVEFDRGAALSRMEEESIALARSVLVDGRSQAAVAREAQVVRQWVSQVVAKMRRYIAEANPVPRGWRTDTVTLPERDWPKVRALEQAARRALAARPKTNR